MNEQVANGIANLVTPDRLLASLNQYVPGAIYVYQRTADGKSHILYTSDGIRDIYGCEPGELIEDLRRGHDRIHPDDRAALSLLQGNSQVRAFFGFVFLTILGIFLQDSVLEVFGAEQFGMSIAETTTFTQTWGGGVPLGMLLTGIVSSLLPIGKKSPELAIEQRRLLEKERVRFKEDFVVQTAFWEP